MPKDPNIYRQAFTHIRNERLEFLGDAVLGAVVGEILYKRFPHKREGFLTQTRSKIVRREMLGNLAKQMRITEHIQTTRSFHSHNSYLGGNAFEALVGALYLDRGYKAVVRFVEHKVLTYIDLDKIARLETNFKSKILEWGQRYKIPVECCLKRQGQDDKCNPTFTYIVILNETILGCTGTGFSKKEAQQIAARLTLEKIRRDKNLRQQPDKLKS